MLIFDPPDEQWLFSKTEFERFPSCSQRQNSGDGMSVREELLARATGVFELFDLCNLEGTKFPSIVVLSAITFLHRFYAVHAFQDYPVQNVAPACLFLAAKCEESSRKAESIAGGVLFRRLELQKQQDPNSPQPTLEEQSAQRATLTAHILDLEPLLLNALRFDIMLEHPHSLLLHALDLILPSVPTPRQDKQRTNQKSARRMPLDALLKDIAWDVADASLYLPLCVVYPANVIAAACIFLAFRRLQLDVKEEMCRAVYYWLHLAKAPKAPQEMLEVISKYVDEDGEHWCGLLQTDWEAVRPVVQEILAFWDSTDLKHLRTYTLKGLSPYDDFTPLRKFEDRLQPKPKDLPQGKSPFPDSASNSSARTPLPYASSSKTPIPSYLQSSGGGLSSGGQTPVLNELNPAHEEAHRLQQLQLNSSPQVVGGGGGGSTTWGSDSVRGEDPWAGGRTDRSRRGSEPYSKTPGSGWRTAPKQEPSW